MTGKYHIKAIQSLDQFESCSVEWRDLLHRSSANSIFTTWEWMYTWSEHFLKGGRSLFLLLVYKKNELVGIGPFYLKHIKFGPFTIRQIEFLGTPEAGSDYLDVITQSGEEEQVSSRIYHYLFREIRHAWDRIFLRDVPSNSLFSLRFLNLFVENGKHVDVTPGSFCPVVVLPGEKEAFLESLSRSRSKQFQRDYNILCENNDLKHVIDSSGDLKRDIEDLKNLHAKRWGRGHDSLFKFVEGYIDRSRDDGVVQLDLLRKNKICIGSILHLNYRSTRSMYLFSVDTDYNKKISVGNVFLCMCIVKAIEDKIHTYDLLKGDESYKFNFTNQGNRLINISHYQNRIGGVMYCTNNYLKNIGKILFR